jgi:ribosomal protein S6
MTLAGVKRVGEDRLFYEFDGIHQGDYLRMYVDGAQGEEPDFGTVYEVEVHPYEGEGEE